MHVVHPRKLSQGIAQPTGAGSLQPGSAHMFAQHESSVHPGAQRAAAHTREPGRAIGGGSALARGRELAGRAPVAAQRLLVQGRRARGRIGARATSTVGADRAGAALPVVHAGPCGVRGRVDDRLRVGVAASVGDLTAHVDPLEPQRRIDDAATPRFVARPRRRRPARSPRRARGRRRSGRRRRRPHSRGSTPPATARPAPRARVPAAARSRPPTPKRRARHAAPCAEQPGVRPREDTSVDERERSSGTPRRCQGAPRSGPAGVNAATNTMKKTGTSDLKNEAVVGRLISIPNCSSHRSRRRSAGHACRMRRASVLARRHRCRSVITERVWRRVAEQQRVVGWVGTSLSTRTGIGTRRST